MKFTYDASLFFPSPVGFIRLESLSLPATNAPIGYTRWTDLDKPVAQGVQHYGDILKSVAHYTKVMLEEKFSDMKAIHLVRFTETTYPDYGYSEWIVTFRPEGKIA